MSKNLKMMYKTYLFEGSSNVYVPTSVVTFKGVRYCRCVHVCKQFLEDYPVDKLGRRIIPVGAMCPYLKQDGKERVCSAALVSVDGKIVSGIKRNIQLVKIYVNAKER